VCCKSSDNPSDCEDRNWTQNEGYCKNSKTGFSHGYCCQRCNKRINFAKQDNKDVSGKDVLQYGGLIAEVGTSGEFS